MAARERKRTTLAGDDVRPSVGQGRKHRVDVAIVLVVVLVGVAWAASKLRGFDARNDLARTLEAEFPRETIERLLAPVASQLPSQYVSTPLAKRLPPTTEASLLPGKLLVVNGWEKTLSTLHLDLPTERRAQSAAEVETLVVVLTDTTTVGAYLGGQGGRATEETILCMAFDAKTRALRGVKTFVSESAPRSSAGGYSQRLTVDLALVVSWLAR